MPPTAYGEDSAGTDLAALFRVLRRRWWILITVPVLAVAGAYAAASHETPVYQTRTSILVLPSQAESTYIAQGIDPTRLLQDQIEIIGSSQLTSLVTKRLGFPASVMAGASSSDDIIRLTATDASPRRAAEIANVYADAYLSYLAASTASQTSQVQQGLTAQINKVQQQLDQLNQVIANTPPSQQASVEATQSDQRASLNATLASDQTQLIQSEAPTNQGGAQILAPAPVPSTPTKPHPKRTAAEGLAVGIVLAFGLAFLVDYLDNRVRGEDDLVHVTGGLPVLGLIPPTPG
ncbi:MAG: YveK family protein, partial [Acidimicrobiales bacterium]